MSISERGHPSPYQVPSDQLHPPPPPQIAASNFTFWPPHFIAFKYLALRVNASHCWRSAKSGRHWRRRSAQRGGTHARQAWEFREGSNRFGPQRILRLRLDTFCRCCGPKLAAGTEHALEEWLGWPCCGLRKIFVTNFGKYSQRPCFSKQF